MIWCITHKNETNLFCILNTYILRMNIYTKHSVRTFSVDSLYSKHIINRMSSKTDGNIDIYKKRYKLISRFMWIFLKNSCNTYLIPHT